MAMGEAVCGRGDEKMRGGVVESVVVPSVSVRVRVRALVLAC